MRRTALVLLLVWAPAAHAADEARDDLSETLRAEWKSEWNYWYPVVKEAPKRKRINVPLPPLDLEEGNDLLDLEAASDVMGMDDVVTGLEDITADIDPENPDHLPADAVAHVQPNSRFPTPARRAARKPRKPRNHIYHPLALTELGPKRDLLDCVLARTRALLDDLAGSSGGRASGWDAWRRELDTLDEQAKAVPRKATSERQAVYTSACELRRKIALANPLLDFDEILFAKVPVTDQQRAYAISSSGVSTNSGLFVLSGFRDDKPEVRNLLAGREVVSGPDKGKTIADGGCFADPDLDFDGERIVFSWNEEKRPYKYRQIVYNAEARTAANARHIFSARTDGTDLRQLTDGLHHDFTPCWLPNGRIAFISQRDAGANRCAFLCLPIDDFLGRGLMMHSVPRIYSMLRDGSDVRRQSVHDAAEWTPSVDNDGRLVYGRWDYIDRKIDLQSFWISYADGRDQRSPHANYPNGSRGNFVGLNPQGATHMRAIPNTHGRYVYATSSHRIFEWGSLLLLDLNLPDDGQGGQIREMTPDFYYPDAKNGGGTGGAGPVHSTPWPLSEKYYLVAFRRFKPMSAEYARRRNLDPSPLPDFNGLFGLYLLDVFGNRILLYRDPVIDSLKPIPLRPRPRPPIVPELVRSKTNPSARKASIAVMNVYTSDFDWPKDTKITALRVVQVFQNYGGGDDPPVSFTGMGFPRTPLGTVPVYEDGSAWFEAPVDRMLYFQALDENGMAVQSMRSGTLCHPGEMLTCLGCHEHRNHAPAPKPQACALAFRRGRPDPIAPEVNGHEPFTFPRHVQPVLTAKCAGCHVKKKKGPQHLADTSLVDFKGGRNKRGKGSAAFASLHDYAWHYDLNYGHSPNRSVAGEVGARASKLIAHLSPAHHGVKLTAEEKRRITLWMDLGSPYYVSIFDRDEQHAGKLVYPRFDFDPRNPLGLDMGPRRDALAALRVRRKGE